VTYPYNTHPADIFWLRLEWTTQKWQHGLLQYLPSRIQKYTLVSHFRISIDLMNLIDGSSITFGWSNLMGENTLQGGQKCCHIVLCFRGVNVWTSTMVILKHTFPNFLHYMVGHNTKNLIKKEIYFSNYIVWFQSIYVAKKCMSLFSYEQL
jgi:hypothetical protein